MYLDLGRAGDAVVLLCKNYDGTVWPPANMRKTGTELENRGL